MFPGRLASFGAGAGESEIFKMERGEELFELMESHAFRGAPFFHAAFKGRSKTVAGEPPAAGLRLGIEPIDERSTAFKRPSSVDQRTVTAAF
jgi:hypothetical protein